MTVSSTGPGGSDIPALLKWIRFCTPGVSCRNRTMSRPSLRSMASTVTTAAASPGRRSAGYAARLRWIRKGAGRFGSAREDRGQALARAAQPKDLAVGVLVGQSYRYVTRHLGLFLRIGWFWFALSALGALILRVVASAPGRYAAELIDIPLVIAFAVAWHRATL